jgi:CRP/FNR family transcriptional regulator, cyclic AMP receptor protein
LLKVFLRSISLFRDLDDTQIQRLAGITREERVPSRQVVFREGDAVDAFYLVREGLVTVFREEKGKPLQVLARLEPGGFFGEMGLLNDKARRIASARTALPTVLLRIEKDDLIALLADNPMLELKFRAEVIRRHGMNVSALLGLAGQRDVRIHIGAPARLIMDDGSTLDVTLENLSLGGIGVSGGVPNLWQIHHPVRFSLALRGEAPVLRVIGVVTWREHDSVGIAFGPDNAGDAATIHRVVRIFLEHRK